MSTDKIPINALWFDENIFSDENQKYLLQLSKILVGVFHPCADRTLLRGVISDIERKNTQNFVVITSGSGSRTVMQSIEEKKVVVSVVVFCYELETWNYLKGKGGVVAVVNRFDNLLLELKDIANKNSSKFESLLVEQPLVPLALYDEKMLCQHLTVAKFIKPNYENKSEFETGLNFFTSLCRKLDLDLYADVGAIMDKIKAKNPNDEDMLNFIVSNAYMGETPVCYYGNYILRRCLQREIDIAKCYVGTLMYALRMLASKFPDIQLRENVTLYRTIKLDFIRLNDFFLNKGKVVCFPSFTSASLEKENLNRELPAVGDEATNANNITYFYIDFKYNSNAWNFDPVQVYKIPGATERHFTKEVLFTAFSFFHIDEVSFARGTLEEPCVVRMTYIPKAYDVESRMQPNKTISIDSTSNLIVCK